MPGLPNSSYDDRARALREDFPIFKGRVSGRPLIYLDNAATSQKPRQVIEAINHFYSNVNSNVHRGVYELSIVATELFEDTRRRIAQFVGAKSWREVVFTRGTTEAINLVAYSYALRKIRRGGQNRDY
jgi:cysteine desulfurase/selenocysteine lyase